MHQINLQLIKIPSSGRGVAGCEVAGRGFCAIYVLHQHNVETPTFPSPRKESHQPAPIYPAVCLHK